MTAERTNPSIRWTAWFRWFAATRIGLVAGLAVFFLIGVTLGEFIDCNVSEPVIQKRVEK